MNFRRTLIALLTALALGMGLAQAEEEQLSQAEIAEMVNNPLSYLWMLAMQNDTYWYDGNVEGADKVAVNRFTIMPVMPMQLTENYKLVFRPWLPIYSSRLPWGERDNFHWDGSEEAGYFPTGIKNTNWHSGIGDVGFWAAIASNESSTPPFVWGVGVTAMFDTASRDQFGTGRNSAGPMGLAFYIGEKWIVGGLLQHWWDYSGKSDRDHVNLTDFQYVLRYRLTPETNIGMCPNIQYNWETKDLTLPVGGGFDTMIKIGPLPVKVGAEVYYYAKHGPDELHNKWQARIFFVPILPSPKWSRKALFRF